MATKKISPEHTRSSANNDTVVYKVMVALVVLCASIMGMQRFSQITTNAGYDLLFPMLPWLIGAGIGLAVISIALLLLLKKPVVQLICPWLIGVGIVLMIVSISMKTTLTDDFPLLYFLISAVLILYMIYQLYRWPFFLFSSVVISAGGSLFCFRHGTPTLMKTIPALVIYLLIAGACFLSARTASKNKGKLIIKGKKYQLFSPRFNPTPLFVTIAFWTVCVVLGFIFGKQFSYYCLFAAVAYELICAVYFTFQLH